MGSDIRTRNNHYLLFFFFFLLSWGVPPKEILNKDLSKIELLCGGPRKTDKDEGQERQEGLQGCELRQSPRRVTVA